MTSAITITAISRQNTGQFRKVSARELIMCEIVDFVARSSFLPERSLALTTPWFPIAHVLAGYAPVSSRLAADGTGAAGAPPGQRFPSGGTEMGCRHSNGAVVKNIGK